MIITTFLGLSRRLRFTNVNRSITGLKSQKRHPQRLRRCVLFMSESIISSGNFTSDDQGKEIKSGSITIPGNSNQFLSYPLFEYIIVHEFGGMANFFQNGYTSFYAKFGNIRSTSLVSNKTSAELRIILQSAASDNIHNQMQNYFAWRQWTYAGAIANTDDPCNMFSGSTILVPYGFEISMYLVNLTFTFDYGLFGL